VRAYSTAAGLSLYLATNFSYPVEASVSSVSVGGGGELDAVFGLASARR
jgi:hypothetical protein